MLRRRIGQAGGLPGPDAVERVGLLGRRGRDLPGSRLGLLARGQRLARLVAAGIRVLGRDPCRVRLRGQPLQRRQLGAQVRPAGLEDPLGLPDGPVELVDPGQPGARGALGVVGTPGPVARRPELGVEAVLLRRDPARVRRGLRLVHAVAEDVVGALGLTEGVRRGAGMVAGDVGQGAALVEQPALTCARARGRRRLRDDGGGIGRTRCLIRRRGWLGSRERDRHGEDSVDRGRVPLAHRAAAGSPESRRDRLCRAARAWSGRAPPGGQGGHHGPSVQAGAGGRHRDGHGHGGRGQGDRAP